MSPTEKSVARHLANKRRVGGPTPDTAPPPSATNPVSCATSFCWQPFMSDCKYKILLG